MYNRVRFNLATFDHEAFTAEIASRTSFVITASAMVSNGENVSDSSFYYINMYGRTAGASAVCPSAAFSEASGQNTQLCIVVNDANTFSEICAAAVLASEDIHKSDAYEILISHRVLSAKDIYTYATMSEAAGAGVGIGKDIETSNLFSSIMDGQVTPISFSIKYMTLDITIPPGGTLVIDSDHFNVYLDNADVIESHRGEWISINRETHDLVIENPMNATLQATILYTEKYL